MAGRLTQRVLLSRYNTALLYLVRQGSPGLSMLQCGICLPSTLCKRCQRWRKTRQVMVDKHFTSWKATASHSSDVRKQYDDGCLDFVGTAFSRERVVIQNGFTLVHTSDLMLNYCHCLLLGTPFIKNIIITNV